MESLVTRGGGWVPGVQSETHSDAHLPLASARNWQPRRPGIASSFVGSTDGQRGGVSARVLVVAIAITAGAGLGPGARVGAQDAAFDAEAEARGKRNSKRAVPPAPEPPARFVSNPRTQAGRAARQIARRVQTFKNYRARSKLATWVVDPVARWSVRDNRACLAELRRQGIRTRSHPFNLLNPVPTPVELTGRVGGIWYRQTHEERTLLISCEMAARLPKLSRVLRRRGVRGVDVMSAYRDKPRPSFHTLGLGLDLLRFWTARGVLSVFHDFEETPNHATCGAPTPKTAAGKQLLKIACDLFATRAFSTVLTPNYDDGHRDHFHIDARPDDPRVFLR